MVITIFIPFKMFKEISYIVSCKKPKKELFDDENIAIYYNEGNEKYFIFFIDDIYNCGKKCLFSDYIFNDIFVKKSKISIIELKKQIDIQTATMLVNITDDFNSIKKLENKYLIHELILENIDILFNILNKYNIKIKKIRKNNIIIESLFYKNNTAELIVNKDDIIYCDNNILNQYSFYDIIYTFKKFSINKLIEKDEIKIKFNEIDKLFNKNNKSFKYIKNYTKEILNKIPEKYIIITNNKEIKNNLNNNYDINIITLYEYLNNEKYKEYDNIIIYGAEFIVFNIDINKNIIKFLKIIKNKNVYFLSNINCGLEYYCDEIYSIINIKNYIKIKNIDIINTERKYIINDCIELINKLSYKKIVFCSTDNLLLLNIYNYIKKIYNCSFFDGNIIDLENIIFIQTHNLEKININNNYIIINIDDRPSNINNIIHLSDCNKMIFININNRCDSICNESINSFLLYNKIINKNKHILFTLKNLYFINYKTKNTTLNIIKKLSNKYNINTSFIEIKNKKIINEIDYMISKYNKITDLLYTDYINDKKLYYILKTIDYIDNVKIISKINYFISLNELDKAIKLIRAYLKNKNIYMVKK